MLEQIIKFIVLELVQDRDSVRIAKAQEDKKITFTIHVNENDFGKVVGKGGQTIRSIRSLVHTLNDQDDCHTFVDIVKIT